MLMSNLIITPYTCLQIFILPSYINSQLTSSHRTAMNHLVRITHSFLVCLPRCNHWLMETGILGSARWPVKFLWGQEINMLNWVHLCCWLYQKNNIMTYQEQSWCAPPEKQMQIRKSSTMKVQIYDDVCVCTCVCTLIISSGLFSTAFSLLRMTLSLVEIIDSSCSRERISISMLLSQSRSETGQKVIVVSVCVSLINCVLYLWILSCSDLVCCWSDMGLCCFWKSVALWETESCSSHCSRRVFFCLFGQDDMKGSTNNNRWTVMITCFL